jgi:predicted O-linked N-acetylglucosamine transferase (SPINDLY family)
VPLAGDPAAVADPAAKELRASYDADVVLGTLARTEKLNSAPFLSAVAQVLRANPRAIWLWTGREMHPAIEAHMRAAGVARQCRFVGWIDTALYASSLDIFLESFPVGCGTTGYQALRAKIALLSYLSETTIYGMHFGDAPVAASERLQHPVLCADSPQQYFDLANKLVVDAVFRHEVALRGHQFYLSEIGKLAAYTQRFFGSITRVADQALASSVVPK